jgi:hypothetical protein
MRGFSLRVLLKSRRLLVNTALYLRSIIKEKKLIPQIFVTIIDGGLLPTRSLNPER